MIRIANTKPTSVFAFTGRPFDREAALQLNQLRHFDPAVGRWLDEEPVSYQGDGELHRYASNRPE